jgi:hypothetical protein
MSTARTSRPQMVQLQDAFEMGKEHFRLLSLTARSLRGDTVRSDSFSISKWNAGWSRFRINRGHHLEVSFVRGLIRQT